MRLARIIAGWLLLLLALGGARRPERAPAGPAEGGPQRVSTEEQEASVALFRAQLGEWYELTKRRFDTHLEAQRAKSLDVSIRAFSLLYLLAPLALLVPLRHWRRFPGRRTRLVGYGIAGTGIFVAAVFLFTCVLSVLKRLTLALSARLNPQAAVLHATFTTLNENAHDLVLRDDLPIALTLGQLESGADGPFPVQLVRNLERLYEQIFAPAVTTLDLSFDVFAVLPLLLSFGMALLFAWSIKHVLARVITLPLRAAAGEPRAAWRTLRATLAAATREMVAVLSLLVVLFVLAPLAGAAMFLLASFTVSALLSFIGAVLGCPTASGAASVAWMVLAVSAAPVYLVLCSLLIGVGSVFALARALEVARLRMRHGVDLGTHGSFLKAASWSLLKLHALPVLLLMACMPALRALLPDFGAAAPVSVGAVIAATVLLLAGGATVFLFFGLPRALRLLATAPVAKQRA